ncbi:MAG TPA: hypothetical protein VI248_19235 [Kineosporiaceae bacterium]
MLSRRARRQAAAVGVRDPRLDAVERVLAGFQVAGNGLALVLSAVAWVWIAAHGSGAEPAGAAGSPAGHATGSPGLVALLRPLATLSGTGLVVVALLTCLLMAPSVNPFYAPATEHRALHAARTAVFAVLTLSTVALIAVASG